MEMERREDEERCVEGRSLLYVSKKSTLNRNCFTSR